MKSGSASRAMVLLLVSATAGSLQAQTEARREIRPRTMKAEPCCHSLPASDDFWDRIVVAREVYERVPIPAATLARYKEEALVSLDVPAGRELDGGGVGTAAAQSLTTESGDSVDLVRSFDGLDRRTAGHEGVMVFPPDTIVAASRHRVLEASNVGLRLSNVRGRRAKIKSLNQFFGVSFPPLLFDPKVYFDRLSDRFAIVALSQTEGPNTSHIYFSVSRSANPSSLSAPEDWCNYRINGKRGRSWADYPGLGVNERWFAIGVNNFKFGPGFKSAYVYAIPKDKLVAGGRCPGIEVFRFKLKTDAEGSTAFTVQPAQHYSESGMEGDPLFFVSTRFLTNDKYVLWRLRDTGGAKPTLSRHNLKGGEDYSFPPAAEQRQGLPLDTGDMRVMQAAYRNGSVWAVHATACSIGSRPNESCVRALEIVPRADGGEVVYQDTFGKTNWFFWWPGIAVNQRDDVVVAFQRSRPASYLSTGFTSKRSSESWFGAVEGLVKGECPLDNFSSGNGTNRTGPSPARLEPSRIM